MNQSDSLRVVEAFKGIENALNDIKDLFPTPLVGHVEIPMRAKTSPEAMLKKVNGIIKGFDETNAEIKLKNLLKYLRIHR